MTENCVFFLNHLRFSVNDRNSTSVFCFVWHSLLPCFSCFSRDNFLVLDIFFEALNYETIEQKKAYDVAGLLGKISVTVSCLLRLFIYKCLQGERCCHCHRVVAELTFHPYRYHFITKELSLALALHPLCFCLFRWHWRTDGFIHRSQHPDSLGNTGLYLWGAVSVLTHTLQTVTAWHHDMICTN